LLKKTIGDLLALPAGAVFAGNHVLSAMESWAGVLAYWGQVYADFSGYSDMATGLALLLGYRLPINFNRPFLAVSPADFWNRWHISLSSWVRDYLYFPAAIGLRGLGIAGTFVALVLSMVLMGLWHGGQWSYLASGLYHGALLAVTYGLSVSLPFFGGAPKSGITRAIRIGLTFYAMLPPLILFRSQSLAVAVDILRAMHGLGSGSPVGTGSGVSLALVAGFSLLCCVLGHLICFPDFLIRGKKMAWALSGAMASLAFALMGESRPFVYFHF
jgi:alginate O-acetyltransferase complex protein AlgI